MFFLAHGKCINHNISLSNEEQLFQTSKLKESSETKCTVVAPMFPKLLTKGNNLQSVS
jgi:hypothetical protein